MSRSSVMDGIETGHLRQALGKHEFTDDEIQYIIDCVTARMKFTPEDYKPEIRESVKYAIGSGSFRQALEKSSTCHSDWTSDEISYMRDCVEKWG